MSGEIVEYLLGLYFAISTVKFGDGRLSADLAKVLFGILLIALAILGLSPVGALAR